MIMSKAFSVPIETILDQDDTQYPPIFNELKEATDRCMVNHFEIKDIADSDMLHEVKENIHQFIEQCHQKILSYGYNICEQ